MESQGRRAQLTAAMAVDSLNDALDYQIRNAARWVADDEARNEVSDLPLDFDGLQKERTGPLAVS